MTKQQYREIRQRFVLSIQWWRLPLHQLLDLSIVASIWFIFASELPAKNFLCAPLITCLIFRNFSLMHDAVHRSASQQRSVNEATGIFSGGVCLLPFEQWRRSHLEHHTWSGNLDKDPVSAFVTIFPKLPSPLKTLLERCWVAWIPMIAIIQHIVFWALAAKTTINSKFSLKLVLSLLSPVLLWGSVIKLAPTTFLEWSLLPGVLLYLVTVEVVNLPHHLRLPQYRGEVRFPVWEQYQVARSCIYPKWLATTVILNFNYHTEHHLFPEVPWYHLAQLHQPVTEVLGEKYNTDPSFAWIIENRKKPLSNLAVYQPVDTSKSNKAA